MPSSPAASGGCAAWPAPVFSRAQPARAGRAVEAGVGPVPSRPSSGSDGGPSGAGRRPAPPLRPPAARRGPAWAGGPGSGRSRCPNARRAEEGGPPGHDRARLSRPGIRWAGSGRTVMGSGPPPPVQPRSRIRGARRAARPRRVLCRASESDCQARFLPAGRGVSELALVSRPAGAVTASMTGISLSARGCGQGLGVCQHCLKVCSRGGDGRAEVTRRAAPVKKRSPGPRRAVARTTSQRGSTP